MASSPFCKFLQILQTARPALGSPRQVPTLQALSRLAAAFEPADPEASGAPADQPPPEASGVSSPTKGASKAGVSNGAAQNLPAGLGKQASQVSSVPGSPQASIVPSALQVLGFGKTTSNSTDAISRMQKLSIQSMVCAVFLLITGAPGCRPWRSWEARPCCRR